MKLFPRFHLAVVVLLTTGVSTTLHASTTRELAEKLMGRLGAISSPHEAACSGCHALNPQLIQEWSDKAYDIRSECFSRYSVADFTQFDQPTVLKAVNCMRDENGHFSPHKLGIFTAAAHSDDFKALFQKAYGSQDEYKEFASRVKMPPTGRARFSDEEFVQLTTWAWQWPNFPFMHEIFNNVEFPKECQDFVSPKMKDHLEAMRLSGWRSRNADQGLMMFACSNNDPLACFSQKDANQSDLFPRAENTSYGAAWALDYPQASMRVLHQIPFNTSYWMRASADGRFVANGVSGTTQPYYSGMITDLAGLLEPGRSVKDIPVMAYYDPSFFVDNSGFLFQGRKTGICSQRVLEDPNTSRIDWTNAGCSASEDHEIGLYQSIGTSFDGSDLVSVTGQFASDSGDERDSNPPFNSASVAFFQVLTHDGTTYRNVSDGLIQTPFEGDYAISPSTRIVSSRLTGADDQYNPILLGYKFYGLSLSSDGQRTTVEMENLATICEAGRKGNFSFDERFWVFYKEVTPGDWSEFGFQSPEDPEFKALVHQSSNIYLTDLLTGTTQRITRMKPGQWAQFPHFRSDNWLIFMVGGSDRFVVASDAALRLERK